MQVEKTYNVAVHPEDGSYWAEVVELPGCFASGDTWDELWEALTEAVSLYLSTPGNSITVTMSEPPKPCDSDDHRGGPEEYKILVGA